MERCAFSLPLVAGHFGCRCAHPVARRGGPDVDCDDAQAAARCADLFERVKALALPALGVADDLLSMPHSALVKIQHGALLGLQQGIDGKPSAGVADIAGLLDRAHATAGSPPRTIDAASLVAHVTAYRVRRR